MTWRSQYPTNSGVPPPFIGAISNQQRPSHFGCNPTNEQCRFNNSFVQSTASTNLFMNSAKAYTSSNHDSINNSNYQQISKNSNMRTPPQNANSVSPSLECPNNMQFQRPHLVATFSHVLPLPFTPNAVTNSMLHPTNMSEVPSSQPVPSLNALRQSVSVERSNFTFQNESSIQNRYPVISGNENNIIRPGHFHRLHHQPVPAEINTFTSGNVKNSVHGSPTTNTSTSLPVMIHNPPVTHYTNSNMMQASLTNLMHLPPPTSLCNVAPLHLPPPPMFKSSDVALTPVSNFELFSELDKEAKLTEFLTKLNIVKKERKENVTIPEFRSALIKFASVSKLLEQSKENLKTLIEADEFHWNCKMQTVLILKNELSQICSFISDTNRLEGVLKKVQLVKRKREQKKKTKLNKLLENEKRKQDRKELNQEIDKWLDDINEKNLKFKREIEMKKEADCILSEVRKKIHEAKRVIEKIKALEKLRNARYQNSVQKGLQISSQHNENFEKKVLILKDVMRRQLNDYIAEEKALKVMLETEQEGQLEEEAQWKVKRAKTHQHNRQKNILECLFGSSEEPSPSDSIYLFHKFHSSANNSIENLVQIRYQWDTHVSKDGDAVPQRWIVPVPGCDPLWEQCCIK